MSFSTIVVILACVAGTTGSSSAPRPAHAVRRVSRGWISLPGDIEYEARDLSRMAGQAAPPGTTPAPAAVTPTQTQTAGAGRVVVTVVLDSLRIPAVNVTLWNT